MMKITDIINSTLLEMIHRKFIESLKNLLLYKPSIIVDLSQNILIKFVAEVLTLLAPTPQNGQTQSNNLSAIAD